jgi:hypothetical protein
MVEAAYNARRVRWRWHTDLPITTNGLTTTIVNTIGEFLTSLLVATLGEACAAGTWKSMSYTSRQGVSIVLQGWCWHENIPMRCSFGHLSIS